MDRYDSIFAYLNVIYVDEARLATLSVGERIWRGMPCSPKGLNFEPLIV
jgi:hypothetical protein